MIVAEHSSEVAAAGRENRSMAGELPSFHTDNNIREQPAVSEFIEDLENAFGMG